MTVGSDRPTLIVVPCHLLLHRPGPREQSWASVSRLISNVRFWDLEIGNKNTALCAAYLTCIVLRCTGLQLGARLGKVMLQVNLSYGSAMYSLVNHRRPLGVTVKWRVPTYRSIAHHYRFALTMPVHKIGNLQIQS